MLNDPNADTKWEYTIVHTDHLNGPSGPQLAPIWRRKYADGSTDWDQINKLGEDGWEMVNAFPVDGGGTLQYLAFIFKRPKRQRAEPVEPMAAVAELAAAETAAPEAEAPAGATSTADAPNEPAPADTDTPAPPGAAA